jgi:hypothetical protein
MKTLIFLTAENANLTIDNKINIFSIFNQINAPQFPTTFLHLTVVIKLGLELAERPDNRKITLFFAGEDSNTQQVKMMEDTINFPNRIGGLTPEHVMILNVNMIGFPEPGTYQFILHVDDQFQANLSLYASLIPGQPQVGG